MPIKVDLHNNTSTIQAEPHASGQVDTNIGHPMTDKRLELLIRQEIKDRIAGDAYLQEEIDHLIATGACYLLIDEKNDGTIDISLLNEAEEVLDTKTITLTGKLIDRAEVEYDDSEIIYTTKDGSEIVLDISAITNAITNEIIRATRAEELLGERISLETIRATTAERALNNKIENEIDRAEAAEDALDDKIDKEIQDRIDAVSAEADAREAADIALGGRIDQEIQDRIADVDAEESRAKAAESHLQDEIDDIIEDQGELEQELQAEIARATAREGELDIAIQTEATHRQDEDTNINDRIDGVIDDLAEETANRTAADTAISNDLTAHKNNTNNPHQVTKVQVGLGDVVNTGDSATPIENGTTKFTTGGAYTLKTDLETAIATGDAALNKRIDDLDLDTVGQSGAYIKTVGQENGQVSATKQLFDTSISSSSTNNNAPTSKAVWNVIDSLDLAEVGADGSYIKLVSETNGKVSATSQAFDQNLNSATNNNAPTTKAVKDAIDALDLAEVGSDGSYIKLVSETDGKVSASSQAFDTNFNSPSNDNAPTTKLVKDSLDAISSQLENLDFGPEGEDGYYIKTVGQADGLVSATKQAFDQTLENATHNNVPTTKTVADAFNALDLNNVGSNGSYIKVVGQTDGQVNATAQAFDKTLENATDDNAPTTKTVSTAITAVNTRIDNLDYGPTGESGKYIKVVSQTDGKISATPEAFDTTLANPTDDTAPTTKAVADAFGALDLSEVGENGSYIKVVSQTDGQLSASSQAFDKTLTNATHNNAPTTKTVKDAIDSEAGTRAAADTALNKRIDDLDLAEVGGSGKFIKTVSQLDGQVSASEETFITEIPVSNPSTTIAPTTKAVKDYVDTQVSNEAAARDTAIEVAINALDVDNITANLGVSKTIIALSETDGKIAATADNIQIDESQVTNLVSDLADKVDKKTTTGTFVYTHNGSTQGELAYTTSDTASTIVERDANKQINIALTPTQNSHAASKYYVDTAGGKIDTISIIGNNTTLPVNNKNVEIPAVRVDTNAQGLTNTQKVNAKTNIGLENVINTGDSATPVSGGTTKFTTGGAYTELAKKVDLVSNSTQTIENKNNSSSDVIILKSAWADQSWIGFENTSGTKLGFYGIKNDGKPYYFSSNSGGVDKAIALEGYVDAADTAIDNKLDYQVHIEGSSAEITYSGDTVTKTSNWRNLKTGATGSRSEVIHLADATTAGLMSHSDYNQIQQNTARIAALEGQTARLKYTDKTNPTASEIKLFVDDYLLDNNTAPSQKATSTTTWTADTWYYYDSVQNKWILLTSQPSDWSTNYENYYKFKDDDYTSIAVVVQGTNHVWNYYANDEAYHDDGLDTVTQFTNSIAGIILGTNDNTNHTNDGKVYAENDGTGSILGWDRLTTRVGNLETGMVSNVAYDTTNKKFTQTINGSASDIVTTATIKADMGLATVATSGSYNDLSDTPDTVSLTTTAGSERIAVGSSYLNVVTRDTNQTINSTKTFHTSNSGNDYDTTITGGQITVANTTQGNSETITIQPEGINANCRNAQFTLRNGSYEHFGVFVNDGAEYEVRYGPNEDTVYKLSLPGKSGTVIFADDFATYTPSNQSSSVVVENAVTNINGRVFLHYTATLVESGPYVFYQILYDGNNPTEQQAIDYMRYMTGSGFLPRYNYDRPKQTIFTFADRSTWKPQYSNDDGLRLYRLTTPLALESDIPTTYLESASVSNNTLTITPSVGNNITFTNYNQTIKGNGTTFGSNDAIDIKGSGIVSVSGNATNKEITISASHQAIKSLKTDNATAQSTSASESITGSGTINLHKVSKTGSYADLLNKPTIGDAILTLTQNSASLGTFTANATTDVSIDIVTPQVYRYI